MRGSIYRKLQRKPHGSRENFYSNTKDRRKYKETEKIQQNNRNSYTIIHSNDGNGMDLAKDILSAKWNTKMVLMELQFRCKAM